MLKALRQWLTKKFGVSKVDSPVSELAQSTVVKDKKSLEVEDIESYDKSMNVVPYDENLLEKVRTQWQFGDWQSLSGIGRETLQNHPDRAKLALLIAAGHLQSGSPHQAMQYIRLSQDWGTDQKILARMLVAGTHNSLGRAAVIAGMQPRAAQHFEAAITTGTPGADARLLTQARMDTQITQLRMSGTSPMGIAGASPSGHLEQVLVGPRELPAEVRQAWIAGVWTQLAKLDNAELATQSNRAELALYAASGYQQLDDAEGLQRCSRLAQDWGCSRQKIHAILTAGIRNTFAITETLAGQYESAAKNFAASLRVDATEPKPQAIKARMRRQLKNLKTIDFEKTYEAVANYIQSTEVKHESV